MKLLDHQFIFWGHLFSLTNHAHQRGWLIVGKELERTEYQQKEYVRTKASHTMRSYHLKGLAIDLRFYKNGKWVSLNKNLKELGDYWESLDPLNVWGGRWINKDWPNGDIQHFERRATEVWE